MFLFKKKEIVLDCFTTDPFSYEFTKLQPAVKYLPEWWENLDTSVKHMENEIVSTMKNCHGFISLYKNSFILPYWGNLELDISSKTEKTYSWNTTYSIPYVEKSETIGYHLPTQFDGFVDSNYFHIKITSPWILKSKRNIDYITFDPIWNRSNITDYTILPGVTDYKYQHGTHINIMVEYRDKPRKINISVGEPILHITPLTEEKVVLKYHLIDEKEYNKFSSLRVWKGTPGKVYSDSKNFINNYIKINKSKCPMGFSK